MQKAACKNSIQIPRNVIGKTPIKLYEHFFQTLLGRITMILRTDSFSHNRWSDRQNVYIEPCVLPLAVPDVTWLSGQSGCMHLNK